MNISTGHNVDDGEGDISGEVGELFHVMIELT